MGQKIRPDSLRVGIIRDFTSRWFGGKNFSSKLQEDEVIRKAIKEKVSLAGIVRVEIERNAGGEFRIILKAAKPGLIIGRGGQGIEELTKFLKSRLQALMRKRGVKNPKVSLSLNIEELKRTEIAAQYVAQMIAWDIERRLPVRRIMKRAIENVMQNKEVQGVKVKLSGRLGGNEIARKEWLAKGKLPLATLRANIDYGEATAYCTYGTIGVKVWVYKGLVFDKDIKKEEKRIV